MFKKYDIRIKTDKGFKWTITFYVNSKATRSGFIHRAVCLGVLPKDDPSTYSKEEHKARFYKVSYVNRTWEEWPGQTCLSRLWEKIVSCKSIRVDQLPRKNPFRDGAPEPKHEDIPEADAIFNRD